MVAAEAAACGVVPIVSDHSGLAEVAAGLGRGRGHVRRQRRRPGAAASTRCSDCPRPSAAAWAHSPGRPWWRGGAGSGSRAACSPRLKGARRRADRGACERLRHPRTAPASRPPAASPWRLCGGPVPDALGGGVRAARGACRRPHRRRQSGVSGHVRLHRRGGASADRRRPGPRGRAARCSPSASASAETSRFELIGVTKSGDPRYLEATARSIVQDGEERELLTLRDVTDRRVAEEEAGVLAFQYAADLTVVAEVARRLPRTADATSARLAICEAALEVCDGAMAVLMEPDGNGNLVSTAMAGAHCQPLLVPIDHSSSATAQVFNSREPFFADLSTHGGVSPQLVEATGLVTALWQPVLRDGDPVGVLLVAWDRHVTLISDRAAAVVGLFAAEAAVAVERVDILARLDELNTALAQQVEALRLSDQFKSDFVSSVSHELRTPAVLDPRLHRHPGQRRGGGDDARPGGVPRDHRPQRPPPPHADQRSADAVGARERQRRRPPRADRPVRARVPEHADPRAGGRARAGSGSTWPSPTGSSPRSSTPTASRRC